LEASTPGEGIRFGDATSSGAAGDRPDGWPEAVFAGRLAVEAGAPLGAPAGRSRKAFFDVVASIEVLNYAGWGLNAEDLRRIARRAGERVRVGPRDGRDHPGHLRYSLIFPK